MDRCFSSDHRVGGLLRGRTALVVLPALLVLTLSTTAMAADGGDPAAAPQVAPSATAPKPTKKADNTDLERLGDSLLDPVDLRKRTRPGDASARVDAGHIHGSDAADTARSVDAGVDAGHDAPTYADATTVPAASSAASAPPPSPAVAAAPEPPVEPPVEPPPVAVGRAARAQRIASGKNVEPQGPTNSPFAKVGIPLKAVPAVATLAAAGGLALWPFLAKTVTGLFKGLVGGLLKKKAKADLKVDATALAIAFLGFRVRPAELGALTIAALTYGLAVCYTLQGWKMAAPFVTSQEVLIVAIYFSRSIVRFVYERAFKLTTQYKFWPGGGLLCLGSAYLGNTLGTVGFEVESTKTPEDAERIVKMKAWLIVLALAMALVFFAANVVSPAKILQSGRTMLSGMALGEIMPIQPMPGQKIYKWRKDVWAVLFVVVVWTFFLINFVL